MSDDQLVRFFKIFGPRPMWYMQDGDGFRITGHKRFETEEKVRQWIRENKNPALYFQVQGGTAESVYRPVIDEIDTIFAFPIDIDPATKTRPATEEERAPCFDVARKISTELIRAGLEPPMIIDSGNGAQLFVRMRASLPDRASREKWMELFRRFQRWIQEKFWDDRIEIDSMADLSRVMALVGTTKRKLKGIDAPTETRPFRVVQIVDEGQETPTEVFEKFVSSLPPAPAVESEKIPLSLVEIPGDRNISPRVEKLLTTSLGDESEIEFAVACALGEEGWTADEIYTILQTASSIRSPDDPKRGRLDYYQRTISKALESTKELRTRVETLRRGRTMPTHTRSAAPPPGPSGEEEYVKPNMTVSKFLQEESDASFSDSGNAERFAERYKTNLRFLFETGQWVCWDGTRWRVDNNGILAQSLAEAAARDFLVEVAETLTGEALKAAMGWGLQSLGASRINATVQLARARLAISIFEFDTNPHLLNCENGTIDLRTGARRNHDQKDFITHLVPHNYVPGTPCPRWLQFLAETQPNIPLEYKQRFYGYSASGENRERKFEIRQGRAGKNGKSTEKNVIMHVLGQDLAIEIPISTFIERKRDYKGDDMVELRNKRLVFASEPGRGVILNVSMLKAIVGRDELRCRPLHSNAWIRFTPQFKIVIITNPELRVYDLDDPIWDRLLLVPYNVAFAEDKQDKTLETTLKGETTGILAWIVEGAKKWYESGLDTPRSVKTATEAYRESQDIISQFLKDFHGSFPMRSGELYAQYALWNSNEGAGKEGMLGTKRFAAEMDRLGYETQKKENGNFWRKKAVVSSIHAVVEPLSLPPAENSASSQVSMEKTHAAGGSGGKNSISTKHNAIRDNIVKVPPVASSLQPYGEKAENGSGEGLEGEQISVDQAQKTLEQAEPALKPVVDATEAAQTKIRKSKLIRSDEDLKAYREGTL